MTNPPSEFVPVYESSDGIGGYSPNGELDHAFAYDGSSSGACDHIVIYRPGSGLCSVIRNYGGQFGAIYQAKKGGIGGWDFSFYKDRAFAYDYDHSGKMDHIVCYRPGAGGVYILKHNGSGEFAPVYRQNATASRTHADGNGLGGWEFRYPYDRMFAFDFDRSKKKDAIFVYRRATGRISIIKNYNGQFAPVASEWCWGFAGGAFKPDDNARYAFPYDWTHTGYLDHIFFIDSVGAHHSSAMITHQDDKFVVVWRNEKLPLHFPVAGAYGGKTGFEVFKVLGFTLDFSSSGMDDHFGLFNASAGRIWLMTSPSSDGNWEVRYKQETEGIGTWDVKGGINDRCFAFDYDQTGFNDHIFIYRRNHGNVWILKRADHQPGPNKLISPGHVPSGWPPQIIPPMPQTTFKAVYGTGKGVAGYDLASPHDRCFTYDYDHSGKRDHLCFYRPGAGAITIVKHDEGNNMKAVYSRSGIGGFDLMSNLDRAFAFDYEHNGQQDHICIYRPRAGLFWILKHNKGSFSAVYPSSKPSLQHGQGIAGYNLKAQVERAFAFDYEHSGKQDYIVAYRPGNETIVVVKHEDGALKTVHGSQGLAGFDLKSPHDRIFAFDYDHSGKLDHLVLMRPGSEIVVIVKNTNGKFSQIYGHGGPNTKEISYQYFWLSPIGGWGLDSTADHAFPYDLNSSGCLDHICFYRPGSGMIYIVQNLMGGFSPAYQGFSAGLGSYSHKVLPYSYPLYIPDASGLAGYDFKSPKDRCLPFDFNSSGCSDHLVVFRPGDKTLAIYKPQNPPAAVKTNAVRSIP